MTSEWDGMRLREAKVGENTHRHPAQPQRVPFHIDLSHLMDFPPIILIQPIDKLVLRFPYGQADVISLTDVPSGDAITRLDEFFLVHYSGRESVEGGLKEGLVGDG